MTIITVWLGISTVGLAFALYDLWDGAIDLRTLEALGIHDSRATAAKRNVRSQAARVAVLGAFSAIGIAAALSLRGPAIAWTLTGSAAVIALDAVWDRFSRRKLLDQVRRERADAVARARGQL